MRPAVDLVMPVYNEEKVLPDVLASLARQVDSAGSLLPRGAFRIIAVDNASTDRSPIVLENWRGTLELVVLAEPVKGVVAARVRGGNFALEDASRPVVVHTDSDSLFPATFIDTISRRFERGGIDVFSYSGFPPTEYWLKAPRLAARQFTEVGSISFSPESLIALGFDERSALLTPEIFRDFQNVPMQCGFAMTKDIYRRVGGYIREFNSDGSERLGEARNLAFRLDLRRRPFRSCALASRCLKSAAATAGGQRSLGGKVVYPRHDRSARRDSAGALRVARRDKRFARL